MEVRPTKEELKEVIQKHYDYLCDLKGEYVAVREMRKHLSAYIKGFPNATEMRRNINELESKTEVMKLLEKK